MLKFLSRFILEGEFSLGNTFHIAHNNLVDDIKVLIRDSVPLILSSLIQICFPIISIAFCGIVGTNELDAGSLATSIINVAVYANINGLSSAADTLFPQIFGGSDKKLVGLVLQKGIIISLLSFFLSAAMLLSANKLMVYIIHEPEILKLTDQYLVAFIPSILFNSVVTLLSKYLQSQNIIYPTMFMNIIGITVNYILHYHFIINLNMGVTGAAHAVNYSTFVLMAMIFFYIYFKNLYQDTWSGWNYDCLYGWKEYLMLGIPGFIGFMFDLAFFEIGTFAAGNLGKIELGCMSISQEILFIVFQFSYGIGIAGNIHVGQHLGSNQPERAKSYVRATFFLSTISAVFLSTLVFIFSDRIPLIFSHDSQIIVETSKVLKWIAVVHLLDGTQGMCTGILKAVGAQLYSSIVMFLSFYVVGSWLCLYLLYKTDLAVQGFFIGIVFAELFLVFMQCIYIKRINWRAVAQSAQNYMPQEDSHSLIKVDTKVLKPQAAENNVQDHSDQVLTVIIRFLLCFIVFWYTYLNHN